MDAPPAAERRPSFPPRAAHAAAFALAVAAWTWLLLEPKPVPEAVGNELGTDWFFVLSKCLHCGAYAFLAAFGGLLPRTAGGRRATWASLALHGAGTEFAQYAMALGRHGCVRDVLIDWAGIALGAAAWSCFAATRGLRGGARRG